MMSILTRAGLPRGLSAAVLALSLTIPSLAAVAQTPAIDAGAASAAQQIVGVSQLSTVPAPAIAGRAWISIDATSGQVLTASDPDTPVEPASLTKLMTAYLVFKAVDERRLRLDQQVPVSEAAWRTGGSRMFIEPLKAVTVEELLQGVIVQSGNDASVALAEAVAGSEEAFATLMNQEAKRLGMNSTNFLNATGLPNPQHITTVRDLATLATHLSMNFPDHYKYYKQREFTYNGIKQPNRNRLLWLDPTVDGMKTGHTDAAGYCLVASAMRGERRIVTVVVGTASESVRAQESLKLLNWSFQNFDTVKLYDANQPALQARVWKGTEAQADLGATTPIWLTVPRGRTADISPLAQRTDPLIAPLEQGQQVGTLNLTLDGKLLRSVPLTVLKPVPEAGLFGRLLDAVRLWFN